MPYLSTSHDPWGVALSLFIASFASYVAIDLAKRVRTDERAIARAWVIGGSLAMGTGIWSMHFVGMLAMSMPIPHGYAAWPTAVSWLAAVTASAIALTIVARGAVDRRRLAVGAVTIGIGISAMHYIGMSALLMSPAIAWNWPWVAVSVAVAITTAAAALRLFAWICARPDIGPAPQAGAAVAMGMAIGGMHYTAMAAAHFPHDSVSLAAGALAGEGLATLIALASLTLLAAALFTSIIDARTQSRMNRLLRKLSGAHAELRVAHQELERRAFRDPLTGLPNRVLFEDRLTHAVSLSQRARGSNDQPARLAVLFVDLDGFKPVNDSFGHAAGDLVLCEAAARLERNARDCDTVARVGGDEFLLLMEQLDSVADAQALARRLVDALGAPFSIAGRHLSISASVGIVVHPDNGEPDKLIAHADAAMYAAKRAGGRTCALYESHMEAGALEQLSLQSDLREALNRGQLELHYQPKVDSLRGQICGVEALLRWHHPERGTISPGVFIPIAERFGLMNIIGNWVIDDACRQMQAWADDGVRMRVAINLSVHQLRQEDLAQRIQAALARHQVDPSQLLCEITESVAMEDIEATQRAFGQLARIGVYLSIDDFGTGYSSLSYLRQLPAKQLKIDRSFVMDLEVSADARAVVDAVVHLARALGLRVVAEGVETSGQRDILLGMGCDELQGFYFARPMAAHTLLDWITGTKPAGTVDFAPSLIDESLA